MSLTSEISTLLNTISNVYVGDKPATPDNVVAIFNKGGEKRSLSGTQIEEPTFQIQVRNTSYATGEALCNTIKDLLHGASTTNILMIQQLDDIIDMGTDENDRYEFYLNFRSYFRR